MSEIRTYELGRVSDDRWFGAACDGPAGERIVASGPTPESARAKVEARMKDAIMADAIRKTGPVPPRVGGMIDGKYQEWQVWPEDIRRVREDITHDA